MGGMGLEAADGLVWVLVARRGGTGLPGTASSQQKEWNESEDGNSRVKLGRKKSRNDRSRYCGPPHVFMLHFHSHTWTRTGQSWRWREFVRVRFNLVQHSLIKKNGHQDNDKTLKQKSAENEKWGKSEGKEGGHPSLIIVGPEHINTLGDHTRRNMKQLARLTFRGGKKPTQLVGKHQVKNTRSRYLAIAKKSKSGEIIKNDGCAMVECDCVKILTRTNYKCIKHLNTPMTNYYFFHVISHENLPTS